MACKSVITHWKSMKPRWKNKLGVKICISISQYALGVQSSAYRLSINFKIKTKVKLSIDNVHLSVHSSIYCQWLPLRYDKYYYKNKCLQYNTTSNKKSLPKLYSKWHKTADTSFSTVIPSLFSIATKYRGWKYHLKFSIQHWVKI